MAAIPTETECSSHDDTGSRTNRIDDRRRIRQQQPQQRRAQRAYAEYRRPEAGDELRATITQRFACREDGNGAEAEQHKEGQTLVGDLVNLIAAVDAAATPAAPEPEPLHTADDVVRMQKECNAILDAMRQRGYGVDLAAMRTAAEPYALMRILVLKGLCTEDEAQGEMFATMRERLRAALHNVEEQQTTGAAKKVQPVKAPRLVVARR